MLPPTESDGAQQYYGEPGQVQIGQYGVEDRYVVQLFRHVDDECRQVVRYAAEQY